MFGFLFACVSQAQSSAYPVTNYPKITSPPQEALKMQDGLTRIGDDIISIIYSRVEIQCVRPNKLILSRFFCVLEC